MKYLCAGCDLHRGVGPLLRQLRLLPEPGRDEPVLPLLHTEPLTRGIPGLHQSLRQYLSEQSQLIYLNSEVEKFRLKQKQQ